MFLIAQEYGEKLMNNKIGAIVAIEPEILHFHFHNQYGNHKNP